MNEISRIEISQLSGSAGYVTVALVLDRRLQDQSVIQELAAELDSLLSDNAPKNVLLNLSRVEFISSAALNQLRTLFGLGSYYSGHYNYNYGGSQS